MTRSASRSRARPAALAALALAMLAAAPAQAARWQFTAAEEVVVQTSTSTSTSHAVPLRLDQTATGAGGVSVSISEGAAAIASISGTGAAANPRLTVTGYTAGGNSFTVTRGSGQTGMSSLTLGLSPVTEPATVVLFITAPAAGSTTETIGSPRTLTLTVLPMGYVRSTFSISTGDNQQRTRSVTEGDPITFVVKANPVPTEPVTVTLTPSDNASGRGLREFVATNHREPFTVEVDEAQEVVSFNLTGDDIDEHNAEITLTLTVAGIVHSVSTSQNTLTIPVEDDDLAYVRFDDPVAVEGSSIDFRAFIVDGSGRPTVSGKEITFRYQLGAAGFRGTATPTVDYTIQAADAFETATISAGTSSVIYAQGSARTDTMDEGEETILYVISSLMNAEYEEVPPRTSRVDSVTATIRDDPQALSVADVTASEGVSGGAMTFAVVLNQAAEAGETVSVDYTTGPGAVPRATAGTDYTTASGTLTFTGAETRKTVDVRINNDMLDEANETFLFLLSDADNAAITDAEAVGTITDDDPLPFLSLEAVAAEEGADLVFTARLVDSMGAPVASGREVRATVNTVDGAAVGGTDFQAESGGTVIYFPGETSKRLTVRTTDDDDVEDNETMMLRLSAPMHARFAGDPVPAMLDAIGTIQDNDRTYSLSPATVRQSEGDTSITFTVTVDQALTAGQEAVVRYRTAVLSAADRARGNIDFTEAAEDLMFAATDATTSQQFTITLIDDALDEGEERFRVELLSVDLGQLGAAASIVTILDDDPEPFLVVDDVSSPESQNLLFTARLVNAAGQPAGTSRTVTARLDTVTAASTARAPEDYAAILNDTVTFPPEQTTARFNVSVISDLISEADETVVVELSSIAVAQLQALPDGTVPTTLRATGTIQDDDQTLRVADVSASEGDDLVFTVRLTDDDDMLRESPHDVTFMYQTLAHGTTGAGNAMDADFTAIPATSATISQGNTSFVIHVATAEDQTPSSNRTVALQLSSPMNATFTGDTTTPITATGTIVEDDIIVSLGPAVRRVDEAGGTINLTVTLEPQQTAPVTVTYATADATAEADADYTAIPATPMTFDPGITDFSFSVAILPDSLNEIDETFNIVFSDLQGAGVTLAAASVPVTIVDDDPEPRLAIAATSAEEGDGLVFTVALMDQAGDPVASGRTIELRYRTLTTGTAPAGDFMEVSTPTTLTIPPGNETMDIPAVATVENSNQDGNRTVVLQLSDPVNVGFPGNAATYEATGTIVDDEVAFSIAPASRTVAESAGTVEFTVTLSAAVATSTSVRVRTADGTARAGMDYTAAAGDAASQLDFTAMATTMDFTVPILQDLSDEPDEMFTVTLVDAQGAAIAAAATATVTITDDDVQPTIVIDDAQADEGDDLVYMVRLVDAGGAAVEAGREITVQYRTLAPGTAGAGTALEADFTAVSTTLTIDAGDSGGRIMVGTNNNDATDGSRTVALELSSPMQAGFAGSATTITATGTIQDNEFLFSLSPAAPRISEAATEATFTVTLDPVRPAPTSVQYRTTAGTATAGEDYEAVETAVRLDFEANQATRTFAIALLPDAADEPNEDFTVELLNPQSADLAAASSATVTILDDDERPQLRIDAARADEGDALVYAVRLTDAAGSPVPAGREVTVQYRTLAPGAPGAGSAPAEDFVAVASTPLTIAAGAMGAEARVRTHDNQAQDGSRTVVVELSQATNAGLAGGVGELRATGTIVDDEFLFTLAPLAPRVDEGAGTVTFTVTITPPNPAATSVQYRTIDGTAAADADYTDRSATTLGFGPNVASQTFTVPILQDDLDEADETFTVALLGARGASLGTAQTVVTILDDDAPPTLVADPAAATEGERLVYTVRLTDSAGRRTASGQVVSVRYRTLTTGTAPAADYTELASTLLRIPAGDTQAEVRVDTHDNAAEDGGRTVLLELSEPDNAGFAGAATTITATGAIQDDEFAFTLTPAVLRVDEGAGRATFTVRLSQARPVSASVQYATANGTATAGQDYTGAQATTLAFAPNQTSRTFSVPILQDDEDEDDETFTVTLAGALGAGLGTATATATVTIADDDALPVLEIADSQADEGADLVFTVRLVDAAGATATAGRAVTVRYRTLDAGAAGAGTAPAADYTALPATTLTIGPGQSGGRVAVGTRDNREQDGARTVALAFFEPTHAVFAENAATHTARGVIRDDEIAFALSPGALRVGESAGQAAFTVTLSRAAEAQTSVQYATADGTAAAGQDYAGTAGTPLVFEPGTLTRTFTVPILPDGMDEEDETFAVTLREPVGAVLGAAASATVTIEDDDASLLSISGGGEVAEGTGAGESLEFVVTLAPASSLRVSVNYRLLGTATPGQDYTGAAAAGTLEFPPGETTRTVALTTVPDAVSGEPPETVVLRLSEPVGADFAGGASTIEAVGMIIDGIDEAAVRALNETALPAVANAVGAQAASAIADRIAAALDAAFAGDGRRREPLSLSLAAGSGLGRAAVWGRGFHRDLDLEGEPVAFEGNVSGATVGVDVRRRDWVFGVGVVETDADLDFQLARPGSRIFGTQGIDLTGVHPYIGVRLSPAAHLWGSLGIASGDLEVAQDGVGEPLRRDLDMESIALGGARTVFGGHEAGAGVGWLRVVAEGMYARIEEDGGMLPVDASAGFVRFGLEWERAGRLRGAGRLGRSFALLYRQDFGDAWSGGGLEVEGGVDLTLPASGLQLDLQARALVGHAENLEDWGLAGGVAWRERADGRGLSVVFAPRFGAPESARDRLWERGAAGLDAPSADARHELRLQYGLPLAEGAQMLDLQLRGGLGGAARSLGFGADLQLRSGMLLGYEALLERGAPSGADHRLSLRYQGRF